MTVAVGVGVQPRVHHSVRLSAWLSVYLAVCPTVCLTVCLPACTYMTITHLPVERPPPPPPRSSCGVEILSRIEYPIGSYSGGVA